MNHNQNQLMFPRGLKQPEQGYRFSLDSLLLACYPGFKAGERVIDLGTGCGVVSFALLLKNPGLGLKVTGVDISRDMIELSRQNCLHLGLQSGFSPLVQDVCKINTEKRLRPESADHVLANPPYRPANQGRLSHRVDKNTARFQTSAGLDDFLRAGAYLVKNRGKMTLVYLAESLTPLLLSLSRYRLEPKRIQFIHSRETLRAGLVLVQGIKNARPGLTVNPPLILYFETKGRKKLTSQALNFCPFLACNP
ncbi:MAG: methyltransferase domain-containing protein [Desulfohalobiaceae bacterium]|nr:methyltransferase domain-containing protein [Desulfohalobiaceae bacterium]